MQPNKEFQLNKLEKKVLELVMNEYSSNDIAATLGLSLMQVDKIRREIMRKSGSTSLVGLMKYAIREGVWPRDNT